MKNQKTMRKELVKLYTYKYTAPNRIGIDGESKEIKIGKAWLKLMIAPQPLQDFMDEYTYDDSEWLYIEYKRQCSLDYTSEIQCKVDQLTGGLIDMIGDEIVYIADGLKGVTIEDQRQRKMNDLISKVIQMRQE